MRKLNINACLPVCVLQLFWTQAPDSVSNIKYICTIFFFYYYQCKYDMRTHHLAMHLVAPEITAFPRHGCLQPPCTVTGSASFSFSSTIHPRASLSAPASAFFLLKWLRLFQQHSITVGSSTSAMVGEWGGKGEGGREQARTGWS